MTHLITSLSPTQLTVVRTVNRFGQITASQLRRALYAGTPRGMAVRCSRHLKMLSENGHIKRLPYKLSGYQRGSGEFVYTYADSKSRIPNQHTLDVTELWVRLAERLWALNRPGLLSFSPEPWCHDSWGGVALKPDAYVKLGATHFAVEIDRGTEFASALSKQMGDYVRAFYGMDGGSFPQVLFLAHDADRVNFVRREAGKKKVPGLFEVRLFDQGAEVMTNANP